MKEKVKEVNFIRFFRNNQEIISAFIGILALAIGISVLFTRDSVGVIDYGEYTQTMFDMGLSYTDETAKEQESLHFIKVIEKFQVDQIQILQLLQLKPSQSLIYPVSVISIICKLLHISFSTRYLAFLLMIITVFCIYTLTKSAYCFLQEKAVAVGIASCFILLCGNYIIYFNSLYRNGIYFVSFLAFFSTLCYIGASGGKGSYRPMMVLLAVSLLLLNAKETTIVLLPVVVGANIWAMFYCRPSKNKRISYYLCVLLMLGFVIRSNLLYTLENKALFSSTQLYHSFFTGVLAESSNQENLLNELGLDTRLAQDIGKNAYLPDENYVISPNSDQAEEAIFSHLSYRSLLNTYGKHPDLFLHMLSRAAKNMKKIDSYRFLYTNRRTDEGTEWVERFVWWQWVRSLVVPKTLLGYLVVASVTLALLSILLFFNRRNRVKRAVIVVGFFVWAAAMLQFITLFTWQGFAEKDSLNFYFILPYDILMLFLLGLLIKACDGMGRLWESLLPEIEEDTYSKACEISEESVSVQSKISIDYPIGQYAEVADKESEEELFLENPILQVGKQFLIGIKNYMVSNIVLFPNRAALFFALITICIVGGVLFYPSRIGAYNNGDFGRMMTAMNIRYTAKDWEKSDELSLTKVVERYDWEIEYDYGKLLPNHADLSQIWFSVPLKIIDNLVGLQFSTVYVTCMYAVLITISIYFIMQVLFRRFKNRAFWLGLVLLVVILDQVNLGWLNSLFGEGIAFVSFLLVVACMVKIADKKKGTCRLHFIFLFFSELLFIGSKAQFTITAPVMLLGTLILFWYHRPSKIGKSIFYFSCYLIGSLWIGVSAISIYENNNKISSPDTLYQSIFYGLLMIVDDPEQTLIELGLDPEMAVDTGKHAYLDKTEYYCAPRTEKAKVMLYDKISSIDVLKYYLKHPVLLLKSMDITAQAAAKDMPDYILVVGQKTTQEHEKVKRFCSWGNIRLFLTPHSFGLMILIYIVEFSLIVTLLIDRKVNHKDKLFAKIMLIIMAIGIVQYPLTFIGNGFADNTKQLYMFRLIFDLSFVMASYFIIPIVKRFLTVLGYCYADKISLRNGYQYIKKHTVMTGGCHNED